MGNSCWCVARAEPVKIGAAIVPAGVPAVTADVAWPTIPVKIGAATVPAGVPALAAEDVTRDPTNTGAEIVPVGVIVFDPPVVPTSPFATSVPIIVLPLSAATSDQPVAQPVRLRTINPGGMAVAVAAAATAVDIAEPSFKSATALVPRCKIGAFAPCPKTITIAIKNRAISLTALRSRESSNPKFRLKLKSNYPR